MALKRTQCQLEFQSMAADSAGPGTPSWEMFSFRQVECILSDPSYATATWISRFLSGGMRLSKLPLRELAPCRAVIWISGIRRTDPGADRKRQAKEWRGAENATVPFRRPGRSGRLLETRNDSDFGPLGRGAIA